MNIAAVVIGRNEGDRLIRCIASLQQGVRQVIYVDSGSTDDSVTAARAAGADVVLLDTDVPFTAARARNAGLARALQMTPPPDRIQFVDGDCEVDAGWITRAAAFLEDHPQAAVVCGRRRERFPEASVYHWLTDHEWDTPVGQARACGGDALMRADALQAVQGFNPAMIAGEEPELCVRLRQAGWEIWRIDAEMTLHDVAMTRFSQWWTRTRRGGHAYAEGAALHGAPPERHNVAQTRRALIQGAGVPLVAVLGGLFVHPVFWLVLLAWPAQVVRLRLRGMPWHRAFFLTLSKLPEALGIFSYAMGRLTGRRKKLIEYR